MQINSFSQEKIEMHDARPKTSVSTRGMLRQRPETVFAFGILCLCFRQRPEEGVAAEHGRALYCQ